MLARSRPIYFAGRYQSQKVYLPTSVRENHYLLYQFANDYQGDWLTYLARSCQTHGIDNVCVVFSDKAVKVRFADEFHLFETPAQIRVFYSPLHRIGLQVLGSGQNSQHAQILFLAQGDSLREGACDFHQRVLLVISELKQRVMMPTAGQLSDRQHLTFDVLAAQKGHKSVTGHYLRALPARYQQRGFSLPPVAGSLVYSIAHCCMNQLPDDDQLVRSHQGKTAFEALFQQFAFSCQQHGVDSAYLIAANQEIVVQQADKADISEQGDTIRLSLAEDSRQKVQCYWSEHHRPSRIYFLFTEPAVQGNSAYAARLQKHMDVLREMAGRLAINPQQQALTLRFYQALSYPV